MLASVEQSGPVTGQAEVLADGTEVLLGYFDRGDKVLVVTQEGFEPNREGFCTMYLNGLYALTPRELLLTEGETEEPAWEGYAGYNTQVYLDRYLLETPLDRLNTNTKLTVLCELENCYLVEVNGVNGYVHKEYVRDVPWSTGGAGKDDSGSSGQSGNSGGSDRPANPGNPGNPGGSGPSGGTEEEWTPPIL